MSETTTIAEPIEVPSPIYEPNNEPMFEDVNDSRYEETHAPFGADDAASDTKKKEPARVGGVALIVLCFVLQVLVFCLATIATPLDVFRNKEPRSYIPDSKQRACFSMWGYKRCGARRNLKDFGAGVLDITIGLPASGFVCEAYRSRLTAAAAFAVVGIFFSLVTLVFVVLSMCRLMKGFVPGIFALLTMVFLLVCWACVTSVYYRSCEWTHNDTGLIIVSKMEAMKDEYNYGAGFAIMIAAWALELITAIMLFFA